MTQTTRSISTAATSGAAHAPPPAPALGISVVILTLNEEVNIQECIASCAFSDDVHVLDSGSTDATCDLARQLGAKVHSHPFKSFGDQRNWAIDNIHHKNAWVFHLDADERFTPELAEELLRVVRAEAPEAGFYVPSKLMFMGRWLRRSGGYPTWQMRFFHIGRMRFSDYGHGHREETQGRMGRLSAPYLHFNLSKGLDDWVNKHNHYSALEAKQMIEESARPMRLRELFASAAVTRRRAMKRLWYRIPGRPFIRWCWTLFVQGGFLEGEAGRVYARLLWLYEMMICLKGRVLRVQSLSAQRGPAGGPPAPVSAPAATSATAHGNA